ncbi:MAG: ribosomal RNA small subunit methyltransferase A [Balneolaceae bacterium]|nr:MAG: ribosomal RNA small subunit methyltransferase A [Balneolaceae bacterium]
MNQHLKAKKSLGQHFLRDRNMILKIVESLEAGSADRVIEIGPGDGALTEFLVGRYEDLTVIEIDSRMISLLREKYPALSISESDVLKTDWVSLLHDDKPTHVIGNLPYYITSQILFSILEKREKIHSALLMMQAEVAERIVSEPGRKEYGILSVQCQLMSRPEILFRVPPSVFSPAPKVQSAVVRFTFNKPPLGCSDVHLKKVVRTAFNQRRKKLSNSLKPLNIQLPEDSFDFSKRPEAWPPEMYETLTAYLEQLGTFD